MVIMIGISIYKIIVLILFVIWLVAMLGLKFEI